MVVLPPKTMDAGTVPVPQASTNGNSSSKGSSSPADNLEITFLKLLSTEIQNQDPTQPMDPTQMVGQMISLNQLNQLIAINAELGQVVKPANTTTTTDAKANASTKANAASPAASQSTAASAQAANAQSLRQSSQLNRLPFDPQTMMPLDFDNPAGSVVNNPGSNVPPINRVN